MKTTQPQLLCIALFVCSTLFIAACGDGFNDPGTGVIRVQALDDDDTTPDDDDNDTVDDDDSADDDDNDDTTDDDDDSTDDDDDTTDDDDDTTDDDDDTVDGDEDETESEEETVDDDDDSSLPERWFTPEPGTEWCKIYSEEEEFLGDVPLDNTVDCLPIRLDTLSDQIVWSVVCDTTPVACFVGDHETRGCNELRLGGTGCDFSELCPGGNYRPECSSECDAGCPDDDDDTVDGDQEVEGETITDDDDDSVDGDEEVENEEEENEVVTDDDDDTSDDDDDSSEDGDIDDDGEEATDDDDDTVPPPLCDDHDNTTVDIVNPFGGCLNSIPKECDTTADCGDQEGAPGWCNIARGLCFYAYPNGCWSEKVVVLNPDQLPQILSFYNEKTVGEESEKSTGQVVASGLVEVINSPLNTCSYAVKYDALGSSNDYWAECQDGTFPESAPQVFNITVSGAVTPACVLTQGTCTYGGTHDNLGCYVVPPAR